MLWRDFGGFGRTALVAVVLAAVAVALIAITIERAAQQDLMAARAELQEQVIAGLDMDAVLAGGDPAAWAAFDDEIRLSLLGGETLRVKLWSPNGEIIYSDVAELVGQRFEVAGEAAEAFRGEVIVGFSDVDGPENVYEQGLGDLIEFYLPVLSGDDVVGVFEIYQRADGLKGSIAQIRRDVRISIGIGLGLLGLCVGSLIMANALALDRRRRQAERLSDQLANATEQERIRIVGALHDDIGGPLYRILYGLQGAQARAVDAEVSLELSRLESLVRGVDEALRSELRLLNRAALEEVGLAAAVEDLVEATQAETAVEVNASIDPLPRLARGAEASLYRAIQEAVFNVRKHSGPGTHAEVSVAVVDDGVSAIVTDDGVGWEGEEGLGLNTTRRALEAIGGSLDIQRRPRGGTSVHAWVPLSRHEEFV